MVQRARYRANLAQMADARRMRHLLTWAHDIRAEKVQFAVGEGWRKIPAVALRAATVDGGGIGRPSEYRPVRDEAAESTRWLG